MRAANYKIRIFFVINSYFSMCQPTMIGYKHLHDFWVMAREDRVVLARGCQRLMFLTINGRNLPSGSGTTRMKASAIESANSQTTA